MIRMDMARCIVTYVTKRGLLIHVLDHAFLAMPFILRNYQVPCSNDN